MHREGASTQPALVAFAGDGWAARAGLSPRNATQMEANQSTRTAAGAGLLRAPDAGLHHAVVSDSTQRDRSSPSMWRVSVLDGQWARAKSACDSETESASAARQRADALPLVTGAP